MSEIKSTDPRIIELIKGLGIETEFLKELHIHIVPDDVVTAEAIYYLQAITNIDTDKATTTLKKYRLEQIECKPINLGCTVRIKPTMETKGEEGREYFVTSIDVSAKTVLLKWTNMTVLSKPFWVNKAIVDVIER